MARFLVIDDDNTLRQLIVATLESAGHRAMPAASGREAASLLRLQIPDAIITDIVMPDDSLEQVIELRQRHPAVPFIVISGLVEKSPQTEEVAALLKAKRTLPKPFRLPDLLAAVDAVLADDDLD